MKLVIAEKPSVAQSIAAVLGASSRENGYLAGNGYFVSWCFGHLAEPAQPQEYDPKYKTWRLDDLPILPAAFRFVVQKDTQQQFNLLRKLMTDAKTEEVINACDAGREGELIFRSVYHLAGCNKPMKRLWISSMEDSAIREGFQHLLPGAEKDGLYQAALCRAEADWLVGINGSRFFSLLYNSKLNVGRVMSPTLALLVQREADISAFVPTPFWTVNLDLGGFTASTDRFSDRAKAVALADACRGPATVQAVSKKQKSEKAPALYDLTTLQRDANKALGYTAQQTLDYTQSLYEKKLCTYPRTDSRFLTDDMADTVPTVAAVSAVLLGEKEVTEILAAQVCNSKKVSDHHAIIPTKNATPKAAENLPGGEREILKLLARAVLRAVSAAYRYEETEATFRCADTVFTSKGKTVADLGWKRYDLPREADAEEKETDKELPALAEGQKLPVKAATVKQGKTSPPKPYTEDTLLSSMETAGAKETPDDAERKGLGTPATRAGIIEKLVACGYIERKKAKKKTTLIPSGSGKAVITVLPEDLQSPLLTAEWEQRLKQVERGEVDPERFISGIVDMISEIIGGYTMPPGANMLFPKPEQEIIGHCPRCGKKVLENSKGYVCEDRGCGFAMWKQSRFFTAKDKTFTPEIAKKLLENGKAKLTGCKSKSSGKTYDCWAILSDDGTTTDFQIEFINKRGGRTQ